MIEMTEYPDFVSALELEKSEAESLRLRANILCDLVETITSWNVTQKEAALRLGIVQPNLNYLVNGKLSRFSLGALIDLSQKAGLHYELTLKKAA